MPENEPRPEIYRPYSYNPLSSPILVIRTSADPAPMTATLSAKVRSVNAGLPTYNVFVMQALVDVDFEGIESVSVRKLGRTYPLSITQEHFSIEGRGLVREATLERYRADNDFAKKMPGEETCRIACRASTFIRHSTPPSSGG